MLSAVAITRSVVSSLVVSALALSLVSLAHAQDAVQWRVEDGGNGHWYRMVVTPAPTLWVNAKKIAEFMGGHLASIRSDGENGMCLGVSAGGPEVPGGSVWLGAVEPIGGASGFAWVTGEPFDWTPGCGFSDTQQGCGFEDRLTMTSPWTVCPWNDVAACWLIPALLVEWDADCNGDGIVDYGQCRDGTLPDFNGNNIPDCCERGEACVAGNYPVQWRQEEGGNGHWYAAIQSVGLTWDEASDVAQSSGGYLAGLQSLTEDFFVRRLTPDVTATGFWIGASRSAGTTCSVDSSWSWLDMSAWAYSGWAATQPDCWATGQDRVAVVRGTYLPGWHDFDNLAVDIARAAIEWSADCNADGLVDKGQILQGQLVDSDQNGVPDVCEVDPCPGDVTNGGSVDATDLSVILAAWGTNGQGEFDADADNSGLVDGGDLALVLSGWGPCPQ
jgi:hypothetical protein